MPIYDLTDPKHKIADIYATTLLVREVMPVPTADKITVFVRVTFPAHHPATRRLTADTFVVLESIELGPREFERTVQTLEVPQELLAADRRDDLIHHLMKYLLFFCVTRGETAVTQQEVGIKLHLTALKCLMPDLTGITGEASFAADTTLTKHVTFHSPATPLPAAMADPDLH